MPKERDAIGRLVEDNVVSARAITKLRSWAGAIPFTPPDERGIWSDNAPHNPHIAATTLWPTRPGARKKVRGLDKTTQLYPSGTPMDIALRAIRRRALASPLGEQVEANSCGILASVLKYPSNTGLVWHLDAKYYTAGFAFYIHERWEKDGGGILMLRDTRRSRSWPVCVDPLPNRMVMIPAWMEHSVSLVSSRKTATPRLAISGFFVRNDRADEMLRLQRSN